MATIAIRELSLPQVELMTEEASAIKGGQFPSEVGGSPPPKPRRPYKIYIPFF